ncbi:MAG: hypothetical protein K8S94_03185 [Planctomycetia bacterium]|nr:hypothetical protein [Planctomycetia bacterium]
MPLPSAPFMPLFDAIPPAAGSMPRMFGMPALPSMPGWHSWPAAAWPAPETAVVLAAADPEDGEEEEIGDEEDLAVAQPATDEESTFDDFDDEFDDDFEEDEDDPDWDHPGEGDTDTPPPGKAPGRKK